jgi:hypothetical protein
MPPKTKNGPVGDPKVDRLTARRGGVEGARKALADKPKNTNQSIKECERCQAMTKSGEQCRNRTCKADRCWQHLRRDEGLRIKQSQVPGGGMGLWTTRRYKPNEKIGMYTGEKMSRAQVKQRYGDATGQYVLCTNNTTCIDARKSNSSAVRYANDSRKTKFKNNAKLRGQWLVAAGSGIPANREIFTSYGPDYWKTS